MTARKNPKAACPGCPFSRTCDLAPDDGRLGDPTRFVGQAAGPFRLPCHAAPGYTATPDFSFPQCAGAAAFRTHLGVARLMPEGIYTRPADPGVFATPAELYAFHLRVPPAVAEEIDASLPPALLLAMEMRRAGLVVKGLKSPPEERP
jgi:hypothetical protein